MSDLRELKSQISATLLNKVKGVTGVGLPDQGITIYLEEDNSKVREAVKTALNHLNLPEELHWQVVGKFER